MALPAEEIARPAAGPNRRIAARLRWSPPAVALFALAWAAYSCADRFAVFADPAQVLVEATHPLKTSRVAYVIRNYSPRAVTVIGGEESCGPEGCDDVLGLPLEIAPFSSAELAVDFRAGAPGEHVKEFAIYLDRPAIPVIHLRVRSIVGEGESDPQCQ